ncbi:unnamed protein product [Amoebophrya sp. A120]|nr:unnamed protein product [Amoebophrya sp. A120]|eukprot:GSA120T00019753001.1
MCGQLCLFLIRQRKNGSSFFGNWHTPPLLDLQKHKRFEKCLFKFTEGFLDCQGTTTSPHNLEKARNRRKSFYQETSR